MAIPRQPCKLCQEHVIWVTRLSDDKRIAIDPDPSYNQGTLGRVHPGKVNGRQDVVEMVPEEERWMRERLYTPHYITCEGMQRCRRMGVHAFAECEKLLKTPVMTQSAREDRNPQTYQRRNDL